MQQDSATFMIQEQQVMGCCPNLDTQLLRHLAIIPDGNRRWARLRGLPVEMGHTQGFLNVVPLLLQSLWEQDLEVVTLWMFSPENWQRSTDEVQNLMKIFARCLQLVLPIACEHGVHMQHLGRQDRLPQFLHQTIDDVEQRTQSLTHHLFNFGLDYGGKDEILRAVRQLLAQDRDGTELSEQQLEQALRNGQQTYPDPDLIIRTSGECRLSGFMPLQSRYSEIYFTDVLFPDLCVADLERAIAWFNTRNRRFGQ